MLDSDDVSLEDLARWKHCARRVRHLVLSHTEKSLLEAPFASFFLRCATSVGESIFPLLKTIAFQETSGGDPAKKQLLRACLSPNLTSITVLSNIPYNFSVHLDDDLEMLSTACDNVQRITIMSHSLLIHNPPLTGFRQLPAIDLGLVSWQESRPLVSQLRALAKLEELRIAFWHINFGEPQPPLQPDPKGFLALRKLRLVGRAPATEQILASIGSTSLQYLEIAHMGMDTFADFDTLVRAVPWMQIASSLRQLYLGLDAELHTLRFRDANPVHTPFFSVLAPLADMHALETLEVSTWNRVLSISDDAVAQMGTAWPRLQHLSVHVSSTFALGHDATLFTPYDADIARPTLSALVHLAERCPSLAYCAIDAASVSEAELVVLEERAAAVDSARMDTTQTRLEQLVPAHRVHSKHFTLPDVERVAHVLRSLFPSIEGVGVGEPGHNFPPLLPFKRATRDVWSEDEQGTDVFRLLERLNELARTVGP